VDATLLAAALPPVTEIDRPFWEAMAEGRLLLQRCTSCGHLRIPPDLACPACLATGADWQQASGRARLWSWIRMHRAYSPAFAGDVPYLVLFAELEEGPRLISRPEHPVEDDRLRLGLPLTVTFHRVNDDRHLPMFRITT
jgi:uncharacterized protein